MTHLPDKFRNNPIWKETFTLAEHTYDLLSSKSGNFPEEEEWNTKSKIRNSINDAMFYISMAVGSRAPGGNEFEWNNAKKHLSSLLSMYLFASRRHFLELDPDIVVKIEGLLAKIDAETVAAREAGKKREQEELEPWMERYRLWQKMHEGEPDPEK